jgi:ubiquitin carboxyl-terminal hydrolase 5/13
MLPEESTVQEPQVNPDDLAQLEAMGFPASRCRRALLQTNNQGIEVAMNWLIEHMDDPEENTSPSNVSTDMVTMLCDMGFTAAQAKKALTETSGDMERAVEWLFSHPDETGEDTPPVQTEEPALDADATGNYQLRTVISHKGTSVHCGHYVAHAQLPSTHDPVWAFFNDSRVVEMTPMDVDDMIAQDCYVVFLERK